MSISFAEWRHATRAKLQNALGLNLRQAHWELTALIEHTLCPDAAQQELLAPQLLDQPVLRQLDQQVALRLSGVPIAHILGQQPFYGTTLRCSAAALVPRPETELLVEFTLGCLPSAPLLRIADLGTGTGAIAIALARALPQAVVTAMESDAAACRLAQENIAAHRLTKRISLRQCVWEQLETKQHLLVSNPPYVPTGWFIKAKRRGLLSDPQVAIDGGNDGLSCLRSVCKLAARTLLPNGLLTLEHGIGQHHAICAIARSAGLTPLSWQRDYAGHKRVMALRLSPCQLNA